MVLLCLTLIMHISASAALTAETLSPPPFPVETAFALSAPPPDAGVSVLSLLLYLPLSPLVISFQSAFSLLRFQLARICFLLQRP
jgi:hypothetical protein